MIARKQYEAAHYRRQWRNLLLHFALYLAMLTALGLGVSRVVHP